MEIVKSKNGADMRRRKPFFLSTCPDELTAAIEQYPNCPTDVNIPNIIYSILTSKSEVLSLRLLVREASLKHCQRHNGPRVLSL